MHGGARKRDLGRKPVTAAFAMDRPPHRLLALWIPNKKWDHLLACCAVYSTLPPPLESFNRASTKHSNANVRRLTTLFFIFTYREGP